MTAASFGYDLVVTLSLVPTMLIISLALGYVGREYDLLMQTQLRTDVPSAPLHLAAPPLTLTPTPYLLPPRPTSHHPVPPPCTTPPNHSCTSTTPPAYSARTCVQTPFGISTPACSRPVALPLATFADTAQTASLGNFLIIVTKVTKSKWRITPTT